MSFFGFTQAQWRHLMTLAPSVREKLIAAKCTMALFADKANRADNNLVEMPNMLGGYGNFHDWEADVSMAPAGCGRTSITASSLSGNEWTFTCTAQYGRGYVDVIPVLDHWIYGFAWVKTASTTMRMQCCGVSDHTQGLDHFEFLSTHGQCVNPSGQLPGIWERNDVGGPYLPATVKNMHMIDLTDTFGAGNEPSKAIMDRWIQEIMSSNSYSETIPFAGSWNEPFKALMQNLIPESLVFKFLSNGLDNGIPLSGMNFDGRNFIFRAGFDWTSQSTIETFIALGDAATDEGFAIDVNNDNLRVFGYKDGSAHVPVGIASPFADGVHYDLEIIVIGLDITVNINGSEVDTGRFSSDRSIETGGYLFQRHNGSGRMKQWFDYIEMVDSDSEVYRLEFNEGYGNVVKDTAGRSYTVEGTVGNHQWDTADSNSAVLMNCAETRNSGYRILIAPNGNEITMIKPDGVDDFGDIHNSKAISPINQEDFAIGAIFKQEYPTDYQYVMAKNFNVAGNSQYALLLTNLAGIIIKLDGADTNVVPSATLQDETFYRILVIRQNNVLKAYLNGIETYNADIGAAGYLSDEPNPTLLARSASGDGQSIAAPMKSCFGRFVFFYDNGNALSESDIIEAFEAMGEDYFSDQGNYKVAFGGNNYIDLGIVPDEDTYYEITYEYTDLAGSAYNSNGCRITSGLRRYQGVNNSNNFVLGLGTEVIDTGAPCFANRPYILATQGKSMYLDKDASPIATATIGQGDIPFNLHVGMVKNGDSSMVDGCIANYYKVRVIHRGVEYIWNLNEGSGNIVYDNFGTPYTIEGPAPTWIKLIN